MTSLMRALLAALLTCAFALAAPAQDLSEQAFSEQDLADAMDFADSNSVMVLYHEVGHLFVGELGLPVLGKNEDAADGLSALLLLEEPEGDWADAVLRDAADGWYLSPFNGDEVPGDWAFMGEHSLDKQRAFFFVCMMVGKDPAYYGELATEWGMDEARQDRCAGTYEQTSASWHQVLDPHQISDENPAAGTIEVIYEDPGDYAEFAEMIQENALLENAAALVGDTYAIPRDMTFVARQCGEANAFYSPSEAAVIFCYEYPARLRDLYLASLAGGEDESGEETAE